MPNTGSLSFSTYPEPASQPQVLCDILNRKPQMGGTTAHPPGSAVTAPDKHAKGELSSSDQIKNQHEILHQFHK